MIDSLFELMMLMVSSVLNEYQMLKFVVLELKYFMELQYNLYWDNFFDPKLISDIKFSKFILTGRIFLVWIVCLTSNSKSVVNCDITQENPSKTLCLIESKTSLIFFRFIQLSISLCLSHCDDAKNNISKITYITIPLNTPVLDPQYQH